MNFDYNLPEPLYLRLCLGTTVTVTGQLLAIAVW